MRKCETSPAPDESAPGLETDGGSRQVLARSSQAGSVEAMARTPQGRFLGLPYNWKPATPAELRRAYWDPDESRLIVPKTYGWGLDINFAALFQRRARSTPNADGSRRSKTPG